MSNSTSYSTFTPKLCTLPPLCSPAYRAHGSTTNEEGGWSIWPLLLYSSRAPGAPGYFLVSNNFLTFFQYPPSLLYIISYCLPELVMVSAIFYAFSNYGWVAQKTKYILGHQGYVMMRHFWLLQEKALSDIGACVLEYRLSWAYILPISLPPNFHFCGIYIHLTSLPPNFHF